MRFAFEYSAALSICGLWIPRSERWDVNAGAFEALPLGAGEEPTTGEVGECRLSWQNGFDSVVLPPGPWARAGADQRQQLGGVVPPGFAPGLVGVECRNVVVRPEKQFEVLFQIQLGVHCG